jgi:hypothetical protein
VHGVDPSRLRAVKADGWLRFYAGSGAIAVPIPVRARTLVTNQPY